MLIENEFHFRMEVLIDEIHDKCGDTVNRTTLSGTRLSMDMAKPKAPLFKTKPVVVLLLIVLNHI